MTNRETGIIFVFCKVPKYFFIPCIQKRGPKKNVHHKMVVFTQTFLLHLIKTLYS